MQTSFSKTGWQEIHVTFAVKLVWYDLDMFSLVSPEKNLITASEP